MEGWEQHFARHPPGHLQAEMTAQLIRAVAGMFSKKEDIPAMADLCPWLEDDGERKEKADRRAAVLRQAKAESTAAAFERWKEGRGGE